jgi:hypothetical protein
MLHENYVQNMVLYKMPRNSIKCPNSYEKVHNIFGLKVCLCILHKAIQDINHALNAGLQVETSL